MADRYFVNGGGTLDWSTSANWSATDGGAGGASVPGSADNVFLTANSPNLTDMNSARTILNFDCLGYTGTFTWNQNITTGSATVFRLAAGMTISGTGAWIGTSANQNFTVTSAGKEFPGAVTIRTQGTATLADAMVVNGDCTLGNTTGTTTINGFSINAKASLTHGGAGNVTAGTTAVTMSGTGTLSSSSWTSGRFALPLTLNTAGTITFSGTVPVGGSTFTYTAGTVIVTGSTVHCATAATTLNLSGITLENLTLINSVTHTISSAISMTGLLTIGSSTGATVVDGSSITTTGGISYGGTGGVCSGTTQLVANGSQSLTDPNRTTGHLKLPLRLNAPGGTITVSSGFPADFGNLEIIDGTTVTTANGTFKVAGTVAA